MAWQGMEKFRYYHTGYGGVAMRQNMLGSNVVTQIGILVHDVEATATAYSNFFGIDTPSWSWTDTLDKTQATFLGEPCPARAKLAFIRMGNLDIELIEPDEQPSTWRNHLNAHGEGVHHIALQIRGMHEALQTLATNQIPLLQKGEYTGGRYAYVDSSESLKVILELLENDSVGQ